METRDIRSSYLHPEGSPKLKEEVRRHNAWLRNKKYWRRKTVFAQRSMGMTPIGPRREEWREVYEFSLGVEQHLEQARSAVLV